MAEGPTLSDFMRHLQAVLEESTAIPDAEEQEQRQWQIEAAIQEAIIFGNRFRELQEHGLDPLRLIKPCLLYTSPSPRDATLSRMPSSA